MGPPGLPELRVEISRRGGAIVGVPLGSAAPSVRAPATKWGEDVQSFADARPWIAEAPPDGTSRRSMLTKVHCCLQVALAPLCEEVLIDRGFYDNENDNDFSFIHSCSDGVNDKRHRVQRLSVTARRREQIPC